MLWLALFFYSFGDPIEGVLSSGEKTSFRGKGMGMPLVTASFSRRAIVFGFLGFVVIGSWFGVQQALAEDDCPLISQSLAVRHGLQRQWHTQVALDPSNNRVTHLTLTPKSETSPDTLFVQTERSTVFAIDAGTGKVLWSRVVGRPDLISGAIGCNDQMVAVINGSTIYILNRLNGRILWTRSFPGVPASGPVLSKRYAYVPLLDGCVAAYPVRKVDSPEERKTSKTAETPASNDVSASQGTVTQATLVKMSNANRLILSQDETEPLVCPSLYRIETQPVLIQGDESADRVAWVNKRGMYVGAIGNKSGAHFSLDYSLASTLAFEASPTFVSSRFTHPDEAKREDASGDEISSAGGDSGEKVPMFGALLVASTDGQVNAIQAGSGATLWEYHVGQPVVNPVIAVDARAYVVTQFGLMLCFDVRTGQKLWETANVSKFAAQSNEWLYVVDDSLERISILRATDGRRIDHFPISGFSRVLSNDQTNQLFLANETGFIQALSPRK